MALRRTHGRRDPMSVALAVLNQLAGPACSTGSACADPSQKAVYEATEDGFRVAASASRTFQAAQRLGKPARLPAGRIGDLFDLTPTDDQRMIVEAVGEFAAEQLRPRAADADAAAPTRRGARQDRRTGHPAAGRARGTRRRRHRTLRRHLRTGRRGDGTRRHGPRRRLPGAGGRQQRAGAVGRRRAAGHLPARVRRRRRAGRRARDHRTTPVVRPVPAGAPRPAAPRAGSCSTA